MIRIRNWQKFQHYKHRDPPWIKLHRRLLDDPDWFALDGDASKMLANCWLLASERDGELPDIRTIAFRLRMTEKAVNTQLSKLNQWLEHDASAMLALCLHDATTETETETELSKDIYPSKPKDDWPEDYRDRFWQAYPRKVGKGSAIRKLEAVRAKGETSFAQLLSAIRKIEATEEKFIPHPTTWLNQGRYLDNQATGPPAALGPPPGAPSNDELMRRYSNGIDRGTVEETPAEAPRVLAESFHFRKP